MKITYEIIGVITRISEINEREYNDRVYKSIDCTIETGDKFKQFPTFTFNDFSLPKLTGFNAGDKVWIKFEIGGRLVNKQDGTVTFFNKLDAMGVGLIEKASIEPVAEHFDQPEQFDVETFSKPKAGEPTPSSESDDLPF